MTAARPRRRFRRVLLGFGLALAVLCATAYLLEGTLTAFDVLGVNYRAEVQRYRSELAMPTWIRPDGTLDLDGTLLRQRPSHRIAFGHFTVETNAFGLRGPDLAQPKPPDTVRVLVLGDSVVFGWGVDDDATFVRRFERDLNARRDGKRYEVVNGGHLMYDTMQESALLAEIGEAVAPDVVLLVYVVNDIDPTSDLVKRLVDPETRAEAPGFGERLRIWYGSWFPATDALWSMVTGGLQRYGAAELSGEAPGPESVGNGVHGWERSRRALLQIRDWCTAHGAPLLVLDHCLPEIRSLPVFCAEHGIACRPFRFAPEEVVLPIYNSASDPHANARGHDLLLGKLRAAVGAEGLLP